MSLGKVGCSALPVDLVLSLAACFDQWILADMSQVGLEMTLHAWAYLLALLPSGWVILLLNYICSLGSRVNMDRESRISVRSQVQLDLQLEAELPHCASPGELTSALQAAMCLCHGDFVVCYFTLAEQYIIVSYKFGRVTQLSIQ